MGFGECREASFGFIVNSKNKQHSTLAGFNGGAGLKEVAPFRVQGLCFTEHTGFRQVVFARIYLT